MEYKGERNGIICCYAFDNSYMWIFLFKCFYWRIRDLNITDLYNIKKIEPSFFFTER